MARDVLVEGSDLAGATDRNVELGYAQVTSNPSATTTTAPTAIAGLTTTVKVGTRPVRVSFYCNQVINSLSTFGVATYGLYRNGTLIGTGSFSLAPNMQFGGVAVNLLARDAPAAGSYTYDVRGNIGTAGQSVNLLASVTSPAFIQVVET